jgi:radical SAM superfamily enzyme YgiQ (UPF0313 family)
MARAQPESDVVRKGSTNRKAQRPFDDSTPPLPVVRHGAVYSRKRCKPSTIRHNRPHTHTCARERDTAGAATAATDAPATGPCYDSGVRYQGAVIRPPSEASSLIVQVTYGCSNNTCDFCGTYLDKPFGVRPFDEVVDDVTALPASVRQRVQRVFLADGDALALSPRKLHDILDLLHRALPNLERVSSYANAKNLLAKSVDELRELRENGLELLYLGLESGDDQTLADIHKGMTVAEQIEGCRRSSEAGLQLSVTAILGLAGSQRSLIHGQATGEALSAIDPEYIGILTLMLTPGTAMHRKVADGEIVLPDSIGMLRELREIIASLECSNCLFRCNHASNYLPVGGHLPQEKGTMLAALDKVLEAPASVQLRPESWRLL